MPETPLFINTENNTENNIESPKWSEIVFDILDILYELEDLTPTSTNFK
jgi:hypothetical protein